MVCSAKHLMSDRLQIDLGAKQAGGDPFHDPPLPDDLGIEPRQRRKAARPLPRIAGEELDWVLTHKDAKVVFRLGEQSVGVDQLEVTARLEAFHSCTSP